MQGECREMAVIPSLKGKGALDQMKLHRILESLLFQGSDAPGSEVTRVSEDQNSFHHNKVCFSCQNSLMCTMECSRDPETCDIIQHYRDRKVAVFIQFDTKGLVKISPLWGWRDDSPLRAGAVLEEYQNMILRTHVEQLTSCLYFQLI